MASKLDKKLAKLRKKAKGHIKKGHLQKALLCLRDAAELARYDEEVWAERAQLAETLGELDEAADSYFHLADMCARSGRSQPAAELVRRVLALNPRHGGARSFKRLLRIDDPPVPQPPPSQAQPEPAFFAPAPRTDSAHHSVVEPPGALSPPVDSGDDDPDTEVPTTEQEKEDIRRLLKASADAADEEGSITEVRGANAARPREVIAEATQPVDAAQMADSARRADRAAQDTEAGRAAEQTAEVSLEASRAGSDAEAVGGDEDESEPDSIGPFPGRIKDEWRNARKVSSEHRISHHSAQLAVSDVIDVFARDPGDVPEPDIELDMVDAVAETIPISPLLSELDSDLVKYLIENSTLRHKSPGQTVFREGDDGGNLYLILRGEVVVERRMPPDEDVQRVATLRPGAFFGEMALLTDARRSATVRAVSMLSLLDIPRATLRHIVGKQSRVRKLLMRFFRARMVGSLMVSSELFRPFSVEDRRRLVTRFRLRELPPGQVVLEKGARSDGLYLVLAGTVEVFEPDDGQVIAELRTGEVFGEISLLEDTDITHSVRAATRGWVLRLPRDDFKELIVSYPEVLASLDRLAGKRKAENESGANRSLAGVPVKS